ncbi:hypothetical protein M9H77_16429 [Catharanthus roseus]|uniref:Uncharacterized protein n=1 Tax=Catharanthus roseus TaxID=4058 RepID=A0ACC0B1R6_CATRO|nr:hypothetical protein M9H77_16429 [Catharanthus roseus]
MMQGRNKVEEVLCLSAEQGCTVFYRNCEDNNVLSDIVIAHPTSIAMIRTWPYVLIMDTTYKTNKNYFISELVITCSLYFFFLKKCNMPLLDAVRMTSTGKSFTVATAFMRNEQTTTYR